MKPSKKEFSPLAMKCNQDQFNMIKPKLEGHAFINFNTIYDFDEHPYLINNYVLKRGNIGNNSYPNEQYRTVHETWNEEIFLNACCIETEPTYTITKEHVLKYNMREEFPEVFEVKLEVNKWYKAGNSIFCYQLDDNSYGFTDSEWSNCKWVVDGEYLKNCKDWNPIKATPEEVFEALKLEAVRRYKNHHVKPLNISMFSDYNEESYMLDFEKYCNFDGDNLWVSYGKWNAIVFQFGQWAETITTITKEEVEKLLNKKIV